MESRWRYGKNAEPGGAKARALRPRLLRRDQRPWLGIAIRQPQCPLDRFEIHLRDVPVVPRACILAEGRIKRPPPAVLLCPRDWHVAFEAIVGVRRQLRHIQPKEDARLVTREFLGLVILVVEREAGREMLRRWKIGGFV